MSKKIQLAVASAVLAMGATAAQAGITIPAGDWTIDIGGNVNAYYTHTKFTGDLRDPAGPDSANVVQTGLLPSALGIGGKTRQNDLDIAFQFTFFTGSDSGSAASSALVGMNTPGAHGGGGANTLNIRQAYLTFGDKSWGTIKMGRDLGIYESDAILSDMTLLGVGVGAGAGGSSTLGRIGSGYIYADWVGQISYWSPNWNGFSFALGIREPWTNGTSNGGSSPGSTYRNDLGYEGKASYEWGGDVSGKVWVGFISQKHDTTSSLTDYTSDGWDIGGKLNIGSFGLVASYYNGNGLSGPQNILNGVPFLGGLESDDKGGYIQATYTAPFGTKFGLSWGESKSDLSNAECAAKLVPAANCSEFKSKSWIVGAYHPLTKSLNLVAEYTHNKLENIGNDDTVDGKAKTLSLGAILFF